MKTANVALLVSVIMIAGALVLPLSSSMANADQTCKFTKANQRCDIDIGRVNGGFKLSIVNEQTNNNTGGGGGGTVDQEARDGVAALQTEDISQNGKLDTIVSENTALNQSFGSLTQELNSVKDSLATVQSDLANLTEKVITGISLSNGTVIVTPGGNGTGNGTGGGTGGNGTGNGTGGGTGNSTGGNSTGNGTGGNGSGNGTSGNGTLPVGLNIQNAFNGYLLRTSG